MNTLKIIIGICSLIFISFSKNSYAQNDDLVNKHRVFKTDIYISQYNLLTEKIGNQKKLAQRAKGFEIIRREKIDSGYVIKLWSFDEPSEKRKDVIDNLAAKGYITYQDNNDFFYITDEQFNQYTTSEYEPWFNVQIVSMTLPTRLRFRNDLGGEFDFSANFSLGSSLSFRFRKGDALSKRALIVSLGANITSVGVDAKTLPTITEPTNLAAFSPSLAFGYDFGKNLQAMVAAGFDILSKDAGRNWVYRKSPWLSFGIGFQLVNITTRDGSTAGTN